MQDVPEFTYCVPHAVPNSLQQPGRAMGGRRPDAHCFSHFVTDVTNNRRHTAHGSHGLQQGGLLGHWFDADDVSHVVPHVDD